MADHPPGLPPPRPIPIKERSSILFIERGQLDVIDGAFVVVDVRGVRTVIPVGGFACLMLEPGTRVSHAAVSLASRAGTLLIWVGEAGVRLYAAGQPGGARSDRLLYQAKLALDDETRLRVVRRMYAIRFREEAPNRRSIEQLRGIEGVRVRETYKLLAQKYGLDWSGRRYDPQLAMRRPLASCTAASRKASSMTSPICSSSRRWCQRRSRWRPPWKRAARCWTASPSVTRSALFAGVAVMRSGGTTCWAA